MEIPRQKRAWVKVLIVAWGLSLPAGAATPSFAADAPAPPTLTLAGDPAIAFQGGYIKFSEQLSGPVIGSPESKQPFRQGDVLYIPVLPDAHVKVGARSEIIYIDRGETAGVARGDRFSVIRPGRRLSLMTKNPDEVLAEIKVIGMQPRTATAYVVKSTDAIHRGDIVSRMPPPPSQPSPPSPIKEVPKAEGAPPAVAKVTPPEAPVPGLPLPKGLEDVYFDFDKWALTDQAKNTLTAQAEFLKQNAAATIAIEGYADERGSTEYNRILGEKRALEVRRILTQLGVSNPITVISFGKDKPVCTDLDEACFAKNRRVHLVVAGN